MAKLVEKHSKNDKILCLISWKEIVQIYAQSVIIVFYIMLKNFMLLIKNQFDKKMGATKQKFIKSFQVLSLHTENSNGSKNVKLHDNRSICPGTQNSELGEHKYIKVKSQSRLNVLSEQITQKESPHMSFKEIKKYHMHCCFPTVQVRFHYVEKGEENDRVILLLHGFPDCFFGWRNQIGILSQRYRVIALDLKGFNDSDRPMVRCAYKPQRVCYELTCFLDALNIKSICLIGHDLGALIGWIFTLSYPDRVNKFFSISTPHPNLFWKTSRGSVMSNYWFNMIQIPLLPEKELCKDNAFIHETYKHLIEDVSSKEINRIVKYKQHNAMETYEYIFSRPEDFTGALNYFRNLVLYRVKSSSMIRCPCILIFGTESQHFGLDSAIKSAEYCENVLLKIIDGAGYWSHQTHATELNAILLKYLLGEDSKEMTSDKEDSISPIRRGIVGRVMDKVYSVSQQYGI